MTNYTQLRVGIIMGSESDWPVMEGAASTLKSFGIHFETRVLSAHRTPDETRKFAEDAVERGIKVIIAGAGGAAHLAGVIAAYTPLPVIGIPIPSKHLKGMDSLLSIVQMPSGVPVATVAIGGAKNAAILAAQILAIGDSDLFDRVAAFKRDMVSKVAEMDTNVQAFAETV